MLGLHCTAASQANSMHAVAVRHQPMVPARPGGRGAVHGVQLGRAHHVCGLWADLRGPHQAQCEVHCAQPAKVSECGGRRRATALHMVAAWLGMASAWAALAQVPYPVTAAESRRPRVDLHGVHGLWLATHVVVGIIYN